MNPHIRISLVVATYNRSAALVELLRSVAAQRLDPALWECVVVDNRSTDDTAARFEAFSREHPDLPLRRIYEPKQGLSHARNAGIAASRGEIVAIVDDDERINPDFLTAYVELFDSRPDAASAGGKVIPVYETGRPHWMSLYTEKPIANPTDWGGRVRPFPDGHIPAGGNMAFRRSALERCGLFNLDLGRIGDRLIGGEESDLFARLRRAGKPCYYTPGAVIEHIIPARKLTRDPGGSSRTGRSGGVRQGPGRSSPAPPPGRPGWTRPSAARSNPSSLGVGIVGALLPFLIGMLVGSVSGWCGGWVDMVIMRIIDIGMCIPQMIYVILILVYFGGGAKAIIIALAVMNWMGPARGYRGRVLQFKSREFVLYSS